MGYSVDIYKIPKFNGVTDKEAFATYEYVRFLERIATAWYKEQIARGASFDFGKEYGNAELVEFVSKDKSVISAYQQWCHDNENTMIDYWCSTGHCFEDDYTEVGDNAFTDVVFLNKEQCEEVLKIEQDWLEEHKLVPVSISKAFRENNDETTTLIPCDGVEVTFENGSSRRIYTNGEYESFDLYASAVYCDDEERDARIRFAETLEKVIAETDFNTELIYIVYGW